MQIYALLAGKTLWRAPDRVVERISTILRIHARRTSKDVTYVIQDELMSNAMVYLSQPMSRELIFFIDDAAKKGNLI